MSIRPESSNDDDGDDDDENRDLSKETGGVVRGISRSIIRMRAPLIGRLPINTRGILRQKLPVKQVARISDRAATGFDFWTTAVEESNDGLNHKTSSRWKRMGAFASNLFRNTLLGVAVFGSYEYAITMMAPPSETTEITLPECNDPIKLAENDDNDDDDIVDEPDEYSRATVSNHFVAGFLAGSVQGVASSLLDNKNSKAAIAIRYGLLTTLHHSCSHSLLFGNYEYIKRKIIEEVHSLDSSTQYYGGGYLITFGVAGGLAGQIQHVGSHYAEQLFGLSDATFHLPLFRRRPTLIAPAVRPLFFAFPPSAIGFIAFEYGKKMSV